MSQVLEQVGPGIVVGVYGWKLVVLVRLLPWPVIVVAKADEVKDDVELLIAAVPLAPRLMDSDEPVNDGEELIDDSDEDVSTPADPPADVALVDEPALAIELLILVGNVEFPHPVTVTLTSGPCAVTVRGTTPAQLQAPR
jgi:hypothetical protein